MNVLGIDLETTGLDTSKDRIIEIGAVVWDVDACTPLEIYSRFVVPPEEFFPLNPEATRVNGIRDEWVKKFGVAFPLVAADLIKICERHNITHAMAHNGENFDKPLFMAEVARHYGEGNHILCKLPWIDTRVDLPFTEEPESRKLKHLALDHGFVNPFPHRAVFDVVTMLKVASRYEFPKIVEMSQIPWITVRALVDYDTREKAKELRYSWEKIGDKTYTKQWVKKIRANQLDKEQELAAKKDFKVVRIE